MSYELSDHAWSPTSWQKAHYKFLRPAIVVVPLWLAFGKCLLGGPFGWNSMIYLMAVCPFLALFHVLLAFLATRKNGLRNGLAPADYFVSHRLAGALTIYYLIHIAWQLVLEDGGDAGTDPSLAERWFGMSSAAANKSLNVLFAVFVVNVLVILGLVSFEPVVP